MPIKKPKRPHTPDEVIEQHAYDILRRLSAENPGMAKRINELALDFLADVDMDQVAQSLFYDLDSLDIEVLYQNSGRTRYGYVDPGEQAFEMFEDALAPYLDEFRNYLKLSMKDEAKTYCMGLLKGLYKVRKDAHSEVMDYAQDAPNDSFHSILEEWKKSNDDPVDVKEMDEFVKENFPGWCRKK